MYRNQNEKLPGRQILVDAGHKNRRIDNYLLAELKGIPRTRIYQMLRKGEVRVNGGRKKPFYRLNEGDRIRIPPVTLSLAEDNPAPGEYLKNMVDGCFLYEDDNIIVLNKPAGIVVHGGSGRTWGIIELLRYLRPDGNNLQLVHRLDRETSGCLLIAKNHHVLRQLHETLKDSMAEKRYLALIKGSMSEKITNISLPLVTNRIRSGERMVEVDDQGKHASSVFEKIREFRDATLVQVLLVTGRTHQIRVHASYQGHPVAGDNKYGDKDFNRMARKYGLRRIFLHASRICLPDNYGFKKLEFTAPIPEDLGSVLQELP